jgi:hypothetical protein
MKRREQADFAGNRRGSTGFRPRMCHLPQRQRHRLWCLAIGSTNLRCFHLVLIQRVEGIASIHRAAILHSPGGREVGDGYGSERLLGIRSLEPVSRISSGCAAYAERRVPEMGKAVPAIGLILAESLPFAEEAKGGPLREEVDRRQLRV